MFDVNKEWKEFNISLEKLDEWGRANLGEHFVGNSANDCMCSHFTEEPEQTHKDALDSQWASVSGADHEWAMAYYPKVDLEESIKLARADAATKAWDALSAQQKKIIAGAELSHADRVQIITDHPQA
ncbi:hypothetical protein KAU11_08000 [Candidatus Babeliales bacterium]|nr:hypothetical protein [Candidatus Babeliales bacterium]